MRVFLPPIPLDPEHELRIASNAAVAQVHLVSALWSRKPKDPPFWVDIGRFTTVNDRSDQGNVFALPGGYLWGIQVTLDAGVTNRRGQGFHRMQLRYHGKDFLIGYGYIYVGHGLRDGVFEEAGPVGGQGNLRSVAGTNPAQGAEISEAVPANAVWRFVSMRFNCAVGAADFSPALEVTDGSVILSRQAMGTLTGGQTEVVTVAPGLALADDASNIIEVPFPSDPILREGFVIQTIDITADDDYTAPQLFVEEWVVPY